MYIPMFIKTDYSILTSLLKTNDLVKFLKENNIPRTIATMSDKTNVDFYFETFNLAKWFEYDKVVYADGIIPSKPAPDIYEIAAKNLNLAPQECIVVEDAISGINSARDAKIGKISLWVKFFFIDLRILIGLTIIKFSRISSHSESTFIAIIPYQQIIFYIFAITMQTYI